MNEIDNGYQPAPEPQPADFEEAELLKQWRAGLLDPVTLQPLDQNVGGFEQDADA